MGWGSGRSWGCCGDGGGFGDVGCHFGLAHVRVREKRDFDLVLK